MERAHVLIRLRGDTLTPDKVGLCRTSETTVRLEHSDMSPGVASITFDRVYDVNDSNPQIIETSLMDAIECVVQGKAVTLVVTGAKGAGKSFASHGNTQQKYDEKIDPGLITLAIQQIFRVLNKTLTSVKNSNVLLSCWGTGCIETSKKEFVMDLLAPKTFVDVEDMERRMIESSVLVNTPDEAEHLYVQALERANNAETQDFVLALHVETQWPNGEVRRGRLIVIDIHGESIVESRGEEVVRGMQMNDRDELYLETPFLVNETLSAGFGAFVGKSSSTYLLVVIQTPAQFQPQAIQSLLYACKAKEIKSFTSIKFLPHFVQRSISNENIDVQTKLPQDYRVRSCHEIPQLSVEDQCPDYLARSLSPPLITTSSGSSFEVHFAEPSIIVQDGPAVPLAHNLTIKGKSEALQKQLAVSRRLRMAYDIAKTAPSLQPKQSVACSINSCQTDEAAGYAIINELLKHLPHNTLRKLPFQAKLEKIQMTYTDMERALAHEISIKEKCVDRISRLSQTLSCQIVEHGEQLEAALNAKHAAEAQLQDLSANFDKVGREVSRLQEELRSLKGSQKSPVGHASENEQAMFHTLSARLEEAMVEAKDVMTFKDGVIQSLEKRLELASKRGADSVTLMEEERSRHERVKADLLSQLECSKKSNTTKDEEILKLKTKVAQLILDKETTSSQWAQKARNHQDQAKQRMAAQLAQAEQQMEQETTAMQQQMAQLRSELDLKVARQRVAAQAACKASDDQLKREIERTKIKLAKQKVKMEKKAHALVASASKEHAKTVASLHCQLKELTERLGHVMAREEDALKRDKTSEKAVKQLYATIEQLQTFTSELKRERAALSNACKELEIDKVTIKAELELRSHEMRELLAHAHEERDIQVQKLTEEHDAKIDCLIVATQLTRKQFSSSVSSHTSSSGRDGSVVSDCGPQVSIDELDALVDSKERPCKHHEKQRIADQSATFSMTTAQAHTKDEIVKLSARQKQLLAALAIANEQETLAKEKYHRTELQRQNEAARYEELLQQLNRVKQENWTLSLALHVTEVANQQQ